MPSSFTPPPNEHQELLMNFRKGLKLLLEKINTNKIIIELTDKGSIIAVMTPTDYCKMCFRHLSDTAFYNNLDNNDSVTIVQNSVNKFDEKYKSILTNNKYDFITKLYHKIPNFYMGPKLHKPKEISKIIETKHTQYIQTDEDILIEGRPIAAGPLFHRSGFSRIVKDSFDFIQRLQKQC